MIAGAKAPDAGPLPRVRPHAATRTAGGPEEPAPARPTLAGPDPFVARLEHVSARISDPAAKLRFLRESLAQKEALDERVQAVPVAPVRHLLQRLLGLDRIQHLLHCCDLQGTAADVAGPATARVSGVAALALVLALAAVAWSLRTAPAPAVVPAPGTAVVPAAAPGAPAPATVPPTQGVRPERIWLVEKSATHELWSNGLRIDTSLVVMGAPRAFRVFDRERGLQPEVFTEPVGILFHTSESDVWPLDAGFNENLRDSTQRLLRYLRRNTTYHYLIDRFGRVWRVVDEGSKANHAGNSVWADGERVFLNLNHAFLAVSFETRWEGGRALPITEAQFAAGRLLTDQLRQRHDIPPQMAVAHGLASVNPKKRLIGHHVDWARGFPFAAFGLDNAYRVPSPAVELFGFGYDDEFLRVMQEPWPGVRLAEAKLARDAAAAGLTPEALRRQRQELYDAWIADQARADEARTPVAEDTAPGAGATED